jgi:glucose/arabinose dehydrogenase
VEPGLALAGVLVARPTFGRCRGEEARLAFHPRTGRLYSTEHGTGEGGNNELNVIERGRNYGWPITIGHERDARFVSPIMVGPDAPAGATLATATPRCGAAC